MRPGDLQLFAGPYALHRVVGTPTRTGQLFGWVSEVHTVPAGSGHGDQLLI